MSETPDDTDLSSLASDSDVDDPGPVGTSATNDKFSEPEFLVDKDVSSEGSLSGLSEGSDSDDEDSEDETHFKRTRDMAQPLIKQHPTLIPINTDEVEERCILRAGRDPNHTTIPFLTKYEKARILGLRTAQLESGAVPLIDEVSPHASSYQIAVQELEQHKTPFIIMRPIPGGKAEYWRVADLQLIC